MIKITSCSYADAFGKDGGSADSRRIADSQHSTNAVVRHSFAPSVRKPHFRVVTPILLCGLIDLDDFKSINDTNGHGVGDQVLQTVASALRSAVRPYDAVARIGGDELAFCLIVRDAVSAEQTATKIFESIAAALRATPLGATCSLGATTSPHLDSALAKADRAMYAAKAAGKGVIRFQS